MSSTADAFSGHAHHAAPLPPGITVRHDWTLAEVRAIYELPLMELVGHPVAVNPDPFLYRTARRRCWPVEFFEPPQQASAASAQRAEGERSP